MAMTEDELVYLVDGLLMEGVPHGIVARVFDLDEELVKTEQKRVRVETFGTADMDEFLEQVEWNAIDVVRSVLASGSDAQKARYVNQVLSGRISARGKRVSDSVREARERLTADLEARKAGDGKAPEERRSAFVVVGGGDA